MKVVFTQDASAIRDITREKSFLPADMGLTIAEAVYDPNNLEAYYAEIEDADGIITDYVEFRSADIDRLKKCKAISIQATGYNVVDVDYAKERGIAVCAIAEYCTQEVADHAMALMLALQRGITIYHDSVQLKKEWNFAAMSGVERIEGQQIGIVGFGKIGQAVGKRAQAFGMQVVAYDPYISAEAAEKQHVKLVDLDTLLTTSDVISIHMNLTKENTAFFTLDVFKKMVKKPFIINVARGAMIDEKDLVTALDTNLVRGAGLDVLESEYPDMKTCPLVGRPNVILTPHSAFYSKTAEFLSAKITVENLVKCLKGNFKGAARVVNDVGLYI